MRVVVRRRGSQEGRRGREEKREREKLGRDEEDI